jgi:hypothetical protein
MDPPPAYQYSEASPQRVSSHADNSLSPTFMDMPSYPYQGEMSRPLAPLPPPSPNRTPPPPPVSSDLFTEPTVSPPLPPISFPPARPVQPPPPPPDFIDMPSTPPVVRQSWSQRPTSPPMPLHPPPVPPLLSPVHATGSTYSYEQVDMPEASGYSGERSFNMDDEEDLYGRQPDENGKFPKRQEKHDNCVVQ